MEVAFTVPRARRAANSSATGIVDIDKEVEWLDVVRSKIANTIE